MTLSVETAEMIREDVAAFADPGTEVALNQTREWLQMTWEQRGRALTMAFKPSKKDPSGVRVRTALGTEVGYRGFLSSSAMSDLRALARNTLGAVAAVPGYVKPRASFGEAIGGVNADEGLELLAKRPDPRTKLIFVTADAGVGKTTLLTEVVRRKAREYALARNDAFWLYVNAQGSRLAKMEQALAAALDDVRAPFPYHAAAALVRAEAMVLVIDGFDELISAPGTYDDAYSSLATFLASLNGRGTIVATARSAYYEQEFLSRIGTIPGLDSEAWSLTRVDLHEWNENERVAFLKGFASTRPQLERDADGFADSVLSVFKGSNAEGLAAKPFFLSRVATFEAEGTGLESGPTLLDQLVNTYLARESKGKLLATHGPVLSEAQFATFYEETANEMWRQETRELSGASFRELVDVVSQLLELHDEARKLVIDRLPNSAMLHSGSAAGSVAFQHEIFFSYFLARPIVMSFGMDDPFMIATSLRKGRLPHEAGDIAGRTLAARSANVLKVVSQAVSTVSIGADQIRQNAGTIIAGMLRSGLPRGSQIIGADFVDADLTRVRCDELEFVDCTFRGADLRDAVFIDCAASQTTFEAVVIDTRTRLGIRGPAVTDFRGLVTHGADGHAMSIYDPVEIHRLLAVVQLPSSEGAVKSRNVPELVKELVSRFARVFDHANIVALEDDGPMRRIVRDTTWATVLEALIASGVVRQEARAAGGIRTFIRLTVRPLDLMAGLDLQADVDPRVSQFWDTVGQT